VDTDDMSMSTV